MKLCGKICRDRFTYNSMSNQEKFDTVMNNVCHYFPASVVYVQGQDNLLNESLPYPEYFAANWVVKEIDNTIKQTVLVVHGSSLVEANKKLSNLNSKIKWDNDGNSESKC